MRQAVYEVDGKVFRFSPVVLDGLLGRGAKGADRMRKLAAAINVSVSSLKDWRRGIHSPSDIEKIDDIAAWAGIPRASLLIEIEGETNMSTDPIETEQLTQLQIAALCKLWNSAHDFLDLAEAVDLFVWPDVKLERIPQSIRPELTLEAADAAKHTTRAHPRSSRCLRRDGSGVLLRPSRKRPGIIPARGAPGVSRCRKLHAVR